jgi:hypothetical protein
MEKIRYAVISAASTDNTVVAAVTGQCIRVLAYTLVVTGAATARFESAASGTALTGQMPFAANGGVSAPYNPQGHFQALSGQLLNLELSANAAHGHLTYVLVPG